MKVDSNSSIPVAAGETRGNAANRSRSGADDPETAASPSSGDRVSLTDTALRLQDLEARIEGQPRVDMQRVEATKEALKNGTLNVDPERIAERLIGLEQALTSARR